MEPLIIQEFDHPMKGTVALDLRTQKVKHCTGCWSCWLATPGACAQHDLDEFYHAFVHAKQAVFFIDIKHDFMSSNCKHLFDRLITLSLPYITYETKESRHRPRYESLCDLSFYYKNNFSSKEAETLFIEFLKTVAHQFHVKHVIIERYQEEQA